MERRRERVLFDRLANSKSFLRYSQTECSMITRQQKIFWIVWYYWLPAICIIDKNHWQTHQTNTTTPYSCFFASVVSPVESGCCTICAKWMFFVSRVIVVVFSVAVMCLFADHTKTNHGTIYSMYTFCTLNYA